MKKHGRMYKKCTADDVFCTHDTRFRVFPDKGTDVFLARIVNNIGRLEYVFN